MNSRDRLLACLRGEIPDRVPLSTYELNGWNADSFENKHPSYAPLMDFIRRNTDCLYMTGVGVPNLRPWEWSQEKTDEGDQHIIRETLHTARGPLTRTTSHSDNVMTTWTREHFCKTMDDLDAYLDLPWEPGDPDFAPLEQAHRDLAGGRGLPLLSLGDPLLEISECFDFQDFVVFAMTETDRIARAMDRVYERQVESLRRVLRGRVQDCVFRICGPEYATPPFLPPELFARFVTPYDSVLCRMIREAGAYPRIHCHGRIARVLDEILKIDPAALDPVEPPPDGDIDLAAIKAKLGHRICIMGGIELKHLEARDETFVDQLTRDLMSQGKLNGRFVLMPTAAPINIPLSPQTSNNYIRWITTALEVGQY